MFPSETVSATVLAAGILATPVADPQARGPVDALPPPAWQSAPEAAQPIKDGTTTPHPYIGMWVTANGRVRQELFPNGRYDEARGSRKSAYQGRYEVRGNQIDYWDDTGFAADGVFVSEDELHHGGMIFYRAR